MAVIESAAQFHNDQSPRDSTNCATPSGSSAAPKQIPRGKARLAFELGEPALLEIEPRREGRRDPLRDMDPPRTRRRLEAARDIDGVAPDVVGELPPADDAGDHGAAMD